MRALLTVASYIAALGIGYLIRDVICIWQARDAAGRNSGDRP